MRFGDFCLVFFVCIHFALIAFGQPYGSSGDFGLSSTGIRWCTASPAEHRKCADLSKTIAVSYSSGLIALLPSLTCASRTGKRGCMAAIENEEADVTNFEAGDIFLAAILHGLIPISVEEYGGISTKESVIVIRRGIGISTLSEMKNRTLCSPGADSMAGWTIPMIRLTQLSEDYLPQETSTTRTSLKIVDCNSLIKIASNFFGESCVPNVLDPFHNSRADNSDKLCRKCASQMDAAEWCTSSDFYAGDDGVLNCLTHRGDVGFMSANIALKLPPQISADFEFICPDGRRSAITTPGACSWGTVPANAFATSSAKTYAERMYLQHYIHNLTRIAPQIFSDRFPLNGEKRYNGTDLLWSDATSSVRGLSEPEQSARRFLGDDLFDLAKGRNICPFKRMRLCVIGLEEFEKCTSFQTALSSRNLNPDIVCVMAKNHWDCMQRIAAGYADVTVVDASDMYLGGTLYGLAPFMTEYYDDPEPNFYAVAVVKRTDLTTNLLDLRGRRTCHGAIYGAAGWSVPISFLLTQNRVRKPFDCNDLTYQVAQIFQKACAPGALSMAHYRSVLHPENLCDLCMGDIQHYCSRNPTEPYYGPNGAFKCLAEGGGHVAFVPHRAVWDNTDGRNLRIWARALVSQDYELLCADGTRAPARDYARCNVGRVPANVVVTSGKGTEEQIDAYATLFEYAQRYFGSSSGFDFKMFRSDGFVSQDLIFRDATTRLVRMSLENRSMEKYLGDSFINVVKEAQCAKASGRVCFCGLIIFWTLFIHFWID